MTYAEYVTIMKTLLVIATETNDNYVIVLPRMIEYAENRILRDLDLIATKTEASVACTPGSRSVTVPGSIQIVESACVMYPAGSTTANGDNKFLQRLSLEMLEFIWPNRSSTGMPQYYSMLTDTNCILAPTPDGAYLYVAKGPVRPAALSSGVPQTWISINIPDLFIAASMVFGTGWQRDFGAQADDPGSAMSWETQYQTLLRSADVDDARRKAQSESWQPYQPEPLAKESRN